LKAKLVTKYFFHSHFYYRVCKQIWVVQQLAPIYIHRKLAPAEESFHDTNLMKICFVEYKSKIQIEIVNCI